MWSGGETGKLKIKQFELMTFDDLTVNEKKKKKHPKSGNLCHSELTSPAPTQ